jgi:hypothetical protein
MSKAWRSIRRLKKCRNIPVAPQNDDLDQFPSPKSNILQTFN